MNINQKLRGCLGVMLAVGASFCTQPALAQVIVHLKDSSSQAAVKEKHADTVAAEMKFREELGLDPIPAPDPEPEKPTASGQKQATGVIKGRITTDDGSSVPANVQLKFQVATRSGEVSGIDATASGGTFSQTLKAGRVMITASAPGWAMSLAGPFELKPNESLDDISIVLSHGLSVQVKIVDPAGQPIADADVRIFSLSNSRSGSGERVKSDAEGIAHLNNLSPDSDIRLTVSATEFQTYNCELEQGADEIQTIVLAHCRPTSGVITEKETGKPIAGAELYFSKSGDPRERLSRAGNPLKPDARTDAEGRYILKNLDGGPYFSYFITAPDGRSMFVTNVTAGRTINFAMPNSTLDPSNGSQKDAPKASLPQIDSPRELPGNRRLRETPATRPSSSEAPPMPGRGAAPGHAMWNAPSIILPVLMPLTTQMGQQATPPSDNTPKPVNAARTLTVELIPPEGVTEIRGWVAARISNSRQFVQPVWHEVKEGKVQFDVSDGSFVELDITRLPGVAATINQVRFAKLARGERPNDSEDTTVSTDADGNKTAHVKLRATGAVHCTIARADGQPVNGYLRLKVQYASNVYAGKYPTDPISTPLRSRGSGEYLLTGIPLDVDFSIALNDGMAETSGLTVASPMMRLTRSQTTGEAKVIIPESKTITVQVIDEKDQPIGGEMVRVYFLSNKYPSSRNMSHSRVTDGLGRATFHHVIVDNIDSTVAVCGGLHGWQQSTVTMYKGEDHATLRLSAGKILRGVLLDDATGRPIIGASLSVRVQSTDPYVGGGESAITDDMGQFEFISLSLGDIFIFADKVQLIQGKPMDATSDQKMPLVLRGLFREGVQGMQLGDLPQNKPAE